MQEQYGNSTENSAQIGIGFYSDKLGKLKMSVDPSEKQNLIDHIITQATLDGIELPDQNESEPKEYEAILISTIKDHFDNKK